MADSVRINGFTTGWASTRFRIDGEGYTGLTSIKYGDGVEAQHSYGMGRDHAPRGMTSGKYVPEDLVITVYKSTGEAIRQQLAARSPSGRSYGSARVPIVLQYIEPDDVTITVEWVNARYVKTTASTEESSDAAVEEITFKPMAVKRNGLVAYDDREEAGA